MPHPQVANKRSYRPEEEILIKEWAERAMVLRVLHYQAWLIFRKKNTIFTIPTIILGTLAGTANVAQSRIPEEYMAVATIAIGSINLIGAILTTISNWLEIAKQEEGHRVATLSWGKYARHWSTELSLQPADRMPVMEALRAAKQEFDRIVELSPPIPQNLINEFRTKNENKIPPQFAKPELLGEFKEVRVYNLDGIVSYHQEMLRRSSNATSIDNVANEDNPV